MRVKTETGLISTLYTFNCTFIKNLSFLSTKGKLFKRLNKFGLKCFYLLIHLKLNAKSPLFKFCLCLFPFSFFLSSPFLPIFYVVSLFLSSFYIFLSAKSK